MHLKKEAEQHAKQRDPSTLILEKQQSPCKAYKDSKQPVDKKVDAEEAEREQQELQKQQEKVKQAVGQAGDNLAFKQTLQSTF